MLVPDVKPPNIQLTEDSASHLCAKLLDFGFACGAHATERNIDGSAKPYRRSPRSASFDSSDGDSERIEIVGTEREFPACLIGSCPFACHSLTL